jgi:hypothetical protein
MLNTQSIHEILCVARFTGESRYMASIHQPRALKILLPMRPQTQNNNDQP